MKPSIAKLFSFTKIPFAGGPKTYPKRSPRAPFRTEYQDSKKPVTFDKNMPFQIKKKAWERDNQDKETWFKRKHGHHHAEAKRRERGRDFDRQPRNIDDDTNTRNRKSLKETLHELKLTPLIDYLYGTNAVLAALKANKRDYFGKLYIQNVKSSPRLDQILRIADDLDLKIQENASKQDLNILTRNGVHNGIVLETKPIEVDEIKNLAPVVENSNEYSITKNYLGTPYVESFKKAALSTDKYPLGLYLDEISDPHNIGAILRSAYFLGVDFIVISEKNCAPLSPLVSKTSSGAMEFLPIYSSSKPLNFFEESKDNGWNIISTVSPNSIGNYLKNGGDPSVLLEDHLGKVLQEGPVLLVVGSEGAGIRKNLITRSNFVVAMESGRVEDQSDDSVDSLNVSVATALLVSKLLQ